MPWNQKIKFLYINFWSTLIWPILGGLLLIGLLFYRLGSLIPGFSPAESAYLGSVTKLNSIINNPVNAPSKLVVLSLRHVHHLSIFTSRAISALSAVLAVWLFYYVAKSWHDKKIAILITILFATSSWFLHYARQATPDMLLFMPLAILAYGIWLRKTKRSTMAIFVGLVIASLMVYVPGLGMLLIAGVIWQRRSILKHVKSVKPSILPIILLSALSVIALILATVHDFAVFKQWLGLPVNIRNLYDYFRHVINIPYQLFVKGPSDSSMWLARLPLLDFVTTIILILGVVAYWPFKLDRSRILVGMIILGSLLVGAHGLVTLAIIIAPIYFIAAAGLELLLKHWLDVYPRNPLARTLGYSLIIVVVGLASYYNLRNYFIAWPEAPATKKAISRTL